MLQIIISMLFELLTVSGFTANSMAMADVINRYVVMVGTLFKRLSEMFAIFFFRSTLHFFLSFCFHLREWRIYVRRRFGKLFDEKIMEIV